MADLTLRKGGLPDWYCIEKADHANTSWMEPLGGGGMAFMTSGRISDADVEGTGEEMLAIADAIENRKDCDFKRCSVEFQGDCILFESPRKSTRPGVATI